MIFLEENTATSFPVITIGNLDRIDEYDYREQCVDRIVEIIIDIDNYLGVGRLFIP
jgi:deoxyhypusine synthase